MMKQILLLAVLSSASLAQQDAGTIIREGGSELFLFSSDYPHPEGTRNPIERFEGTFAGFDEDTKDRFYRRNFEHMFAGA